MLKREKSRREKHNSGENLVKIENLLFLSTLVGSIKTKDGDFDYLSKGEVENLLPNLEILDFEKYFSISCSSEEFMSLPGLRPDLLGELHVLDCLNIEGLSGLKYQKLLKFGYKIQPDDVIAFVIKCYHDFSEHPALKMLFSLPLNNAENRLTKAKLVSISSCFPSIINSTFFQDEFQKLISIANSHSDEIEFIKWVAMSEYNYACTLIFLSNRYSPFMQLLLGIDRNKNINEAKEKFRSVISRTDKSIQIRNMAQLNLGTLLESDNLDESLEMYTEVIKSKYSIEETRACALNNRANIYQKRMDQQSAIIDRKKVIELNNTSADRRFVALFGCGESYYLLKNYDKVVYYMTKIIETEDIEKDDKLCARIVRAVIKYFEEENNSSAIEEFKVIFDFLVGYIAEEKLRNSLKKLTHDSLPYNWDKIKTLLTSVKENQKSSAFDLLLRISYLLVIDLKDRNKGLETQEANDLINSALNNGKRMRITYPEVN